VSDELTTTDERSLQRGLSSVWERIAPLSVGAVASSVAIIAASAVLRRALGPKARLLSWAGTIVVLPLGAWLLTRRDERTGSDATADTAELPPHTETRKLENSEN
jgi:hypothetical protein